MAASGRLTRASSAAPAPRGRAWRRAAIVLVLVLLAHAATLTWMSRYLMQKPSTLRPLDAAIYTRLLAPEKPSAPPPETSTFESNPPVAQVKRSSAAIKSIARSTPTIAEPTPEPPPPKPAIDRDELLATAPAPTPTTADVSPTQSVTADASTTGTASVGLPAGDAFVLGPIDVPGKLVEQGGLPIAGDGWPADTRVNYKLGGRFRSGELYGTARVEWRRDGLVGYQVRVELDVPPFVNQVLTSQGDILPGGLTPRAYEEVRSGKRRGVKLEGDSVTLDNGNVVPRPLGAQDTASQFIELGRRFATGRERLEVGRSVPVWLARPGAVDLWTYDVVGLEKLRTPQLGEIEAWHLVPRPIANPRGNITAEMWFAPSLRYMPVRIKVSMGSEAEVDLLVETVEQR